jgi:hypothetical protein
MMRYMLTLLGLTWAPIPSHTHEVLQVYCHVWLKMGPNTIPKNGALQVSFLAGPKMGQNTTPTTRSVARLRSYWALNIKKKSIVRRNLLIYFPYGPNMGANATQQA